MKIQITVSLRPEMDHRKGVVGLPGPSVACVYAVRGC